MSASQKYNVDAPARHNKRHASREEDTRIILIILLPRFALMRAAGITLFITPFYEGLFLISIPVFRDIKLIASLKIATHRLSFFFCPCVDAITTLSRSITWY